MRRKRANKRSKTSLRPRRNSNRRLKRPKSMMMRLNLRKRPIQRSLRTNLRMAEEVDEVLERSKSKKEYAI